MIFITHDLRVAAQVCDRIAVMRQGQLVEIGNAGAVLGNPQHGYTRLLCQSLPGLDWFASEHPPASAAT